MTIDDMPPLPEPDWTDGTYPPEQIREIARAYAEQYRLAWVRAASELADANDDLKDAEQQTAAMKFLLAKCSEFEQQTAELRAEVAFLLKTCGNQERERDELRAALDVALRYAQTGFANDVRDSSINFDEGSPIAIVRRAVTVPAGPGNVEKQDGTTDTG